VSVDASAACLARRMAQNSLTEPTRIVFQNPCALVSKYWDLACFRKEWLKNTPTITRFYMHILTVYHFKKR
jgi:hypothetical protein